jgi:hypothetical protein
MFTLSFDQQDRSTMQAPTQNTIRVNKDNYHAYNLIMSKNQIRTTLKKVIRPILMCYKTTYKTRLVYRMDRY